MGGDAAQWNVISEIVTTTGPVGTLIVAAAIVLRGELRRRFDLLDTAIGALRTEIERLEKRDEDLSRRIGRLELLRDTHPPISRPAEA